MVGWLVKICDTYALFKKKKKKGGKKKAMTLTLFFSRSEGKRGWFPSNYVEILKENVEESFGNNQIWNLQQEWRHKHQLQRTMGSQQRVTDQDMQRQLRLSLQASDILQRQQRQQESPPSSPSSSSPWILQTTEDGSEQYYYNTLTQEMRYSMPPDLYMDDRDVNALAIADNHNILENSLYHNGANTMAASQLMYENINQPTRPVRALNRINTNESDFHSSNIDNLSAIDLRKGNTQQELSLKEELEHKFVDDERLPPNWIRKTTPKGRFFYCNVKTDETTWELEKIDPDTGILLTSPTTTAESAEHIFPYSPKQAKFYITDLSDVNDISDYMQQMYTRDDKVQMTWQGLSTAIAQAIQRLKDSIRQNQSQHFSEDTNTIVQRIRLLLHASDCIEKETSLHLKSNRQLRALHRSLLASLAKLVLSTKVASNAWPTSESLIKLQTDAEELLIAVRNFMTCAQELQIVIKECKPVLTYEDENIWRSHPSISKHNKGYPEMSKSDSITSIHILEENVRGAISSYMESIRAAFEQNSTKAVLNELKANAPLLIAQFRNLSNTTSNFLNATEEACHHSTQATHNHEKYKTLLKSKQPIYKAMGSLFIISQAITNAVMNQEQIKQSYEQIKEHVHLIDKGLQKMVSATEQYITEQNIIESRNTPTPTQRHYITSNSHAGSISTEDEREGQNTSIDNLKRSDIGLNLLMNSLVSNPNGPLLDSNDDLPSETSSGHHSEMTGTNSRQQAKTITNKYPSTEDPISRRRDTLIGTPSNHVNGSSATVATNGSGGSGHTPTSATAPSSNLNEALHWFLKTDYDPNEMIINAEGNVKGGSLHCLVQHLTQHDQLDSKFNTTFLLTYRSFCTTEELFHELFSRYQLAPPDGLSTDEVDIWKERKLKLVRLRVFNVIKSWLETYFNEEEDRSILPEISHFTDNVIVESMRFGAEQLTKLIKKRMLSEDSSQIRKMKLNVRTGDLPVPILPKNMKRIKLLELDPHELARQMTIMDFRLYSKIKPVECLDKNWGKPDTTALEHGGHHIAANVKASIEHSNQVTAWVTDSILSKEEVKKRAAVLKHWIFVAERCRFLNNYNTCMAILSAFDNGSIGRLKRTWELISTRTMQILQNIRRLMGANRNFSEYRDIIHRINPPCIPFLGIYLQDLTFIEDGNSNYLKKSNNLINFAKRMKTAEVIRDLQQYQSTHYMLTPVPDIQEFIKTHLHSSREEEELYNLSLKLEPRERGEDTIARRLKESGLH
ncbi:ras guanine nucleotide exchange factor domain-containing protein [Mycotypha africana]|uniref:ras guanine nucleotide exchange factor domain-containing protein n=1 Tax=Mycotypha africana TaxID=64632 RepID=UPI0022FFC4F6|nr:ras guanine nucleotide exchange factor domain-containing protein [Mycotypha africana]KAI8969091.1 ras guanine nucleotide exchange factor domain-containing protein [Mycotypha africana]